MTEESAEKTSGPRRRPPRQERRQEPRKERRQAPRPPRRLTAERLRKAALNHMARYACSSEQLRRVLERRLMRAQEAGVAEVGTAEIEGEIARCRSLGLLNDTDFARRKAESLGRQGRSRQAIGQKLKQLGLGAADIEQALAAAGESSGDELARAAAYARRRRLGPFRSPSERATRYDRDLAALARQGFPYRLARQVLDAEDEQALERLLAEAV